MNAMPHPILVVLQGRLTGRQFALDQLPMTIGRGEDCDIRIPESAASRHHARLEKSDEGVVLYDLDSRNGTKVNAVPLEAPIVLTEGSQIAIGRTLFAFRDPRTEVLQSVPAVVAEPNPFNTQALAQRLAAWAQEWGACAVEFRFRHGRSSHSCWVATEAGRDVLNDFFARFASVSELQGVNPSVTEALVNLAAQGQLEEADAYGWINGEPDPQYLQRQEPRSSVAWTHVAKESGWWSCATPIMTAGSDMLSLEKARKLHARMLGPDRSYLYVAIPEKAIRVSGRIDNVVLLHGIWSQEGTLVYQEAAQNTSKHEFQRRVRDAATYFLIWTSVEFLNRESRARARFAHVFAQANTLFNEGDPRLHDPAGWTPDDLKTHQSTLAAIASELVLVVEELGGRLPFPTNLGDEGVELGWLLLVAKAVSHRAVHPVVLLAMLAGWENEAMADVQTLPQAITVASELNPVGLLKAMVDLCSAEARHIKEPFFIYGKRHLILMMDIAVRDDPQALANAVLLGEPEPGSGRRTTRAFSAVRRYAVSMAVEVQSGHHDLGVVIRFPRESYLPQTVL